MASSDLGNFERGGLSYRRAANNEHHYGVCDYYTQYVHYLHLSRIILAFIVFKSFTQFAFSFANTFASFSKSKTANPKIKNQIYRFQIPRKHDLIFQRKNDDYFETMVVDFQRFIDINIPSGWCHHGLNLRIVPAGPVHTAEQRCGICTFGATFFHALHIPTVMQTK